MATKRSVREVYFSDDDITIVSETIKRRPTPPAATKDDVVFVSEVRKQPRLNTNLTVIPASPPKETTAPPSLAPASTRNFNCGICLEMCDKTDGVSLCNRNCIFCRQCTATQLKTAVADKQWPLQCAGCRDELEPWRCVAEIAWQDEEAGDALAQLAIERQCGVKYCANPKCATPFEYEGDGNRKTARIDCPLCRTSTCVLCGLKWHEGGCKPPPELAKLAARKRWRRCPACAEMIERTEGCNHMSCRCGTHFCYVCGLEYKNLDNYVCSCS